MNGMDDLLPSDIEWYHDGKNSRLSANHHQGCLTPLEEKPFIAWDGESGSESGTVSDYHLFLAYTPDGPVYRKSLVGLSTIDCLQQIIDVEEKYPDAIHIGFGLGYDVNMILSTLNKYQLETIHKTGFVYLDMKRWRLEWRKGKTLTVTRYYSATRKTSVIIYDVFPFFQTSFVKALKEFKTCSAETLDRIMEGKERRGTFTYEDIDDFVLPYCVDECRELVALMNHFRTLVFEVGFKIRQWHGPGAIASYLLKHYGMKSAMSNCPTPVREAAQHAYAAGRFEMPKVGRVPGSMWGVDINSAYPYAITQLPDLSCGQWRHIKNPTKLAQFGVYRIKSKVDMKSLFTRRLAPLFHRDSRGRISFPWITDGWYWTPEASLVFNDPNFEVSEGWIWVPLVEKGHKPARPFEWVKRMYRQRMEWKNQGNQMQYPMKLALNSLYGKMAQRIGFDQKRMKPPVWHQLEWAGWVTSYCRAQIYRLAIRIGLDTIVAIETDGLYTTRNPAEVGIVTSQELGEVKVTEYREGIYIQNGLAWLRKDTDSDTEWEFKYRGLDPESLPLSSVLDHLSTTDWTAPIEASTRRFIGIGAALVSRDWRMRWRVWERIPRSIMVGGDGKRIHVARLCRSCAANRLPIDDLHDLVTALPQPGLSAPHFLPWVRNIGKDPPWRETVAHERELIREP